MTVMRMVQQGLWLATTIDAFSRYSNNFDTTTRTNQRRKISSSSGICRHCDDGVVSSSASNNNNNNNNDSIITRKMLPLADMATASGQQRIPQVEIVHEMPAPLPLLSKNHTYLLLRHGQSTANVDSIISSNWQDLCYTDKHGLTEIGYEQGRQAAEDVWKIIVSIQKEQNHNMMNASSTVVFVSSPFARARQTAYACQQGLKRLLLLLKPPNNLSIEIDETIYLHEGLVERSFGRLDGQAIESYAYVWPLDAFNVTHTAFDVESVAAVCHRFHSCIVQLDQGTFVSQTTKPQQSNNNNNMIVVLTSHADVLQIAQLYAAGVENVGKFSSYRFKNGEVRRLVLNDPTALPDPSPLEKPNRSTRQK